MHALTITALSVGAALLIAAALHDVAARTVPNGIAALIAVVGLVIQAVQGSLPIAIPAAFVVFVCAALCWRRGWMGGGDVKLLGATALIVPPVMIPALICTIALAGGLLAFIYLAGRRRVRRPIAAKPVSLVARALRVERWRIRRGGPMPYAVAIACGCFFVLYSGGLP